jgi:hypothetical protein
MRTRKHHTMNGKTYAKVDFSHTKAFREIPARSQQSAMKKLDFLISKEVSDMFDKLSLSQILNEKAEVNQFTSLNVRETELKPTKVVRWISKFSKENIEQRGERIIRHLEGLTRKREVTFEPYLHIVWR